jgi:predicted XRE-type DNA-binding protein
MTDQTYPSVWDAISDTPEEARNLKLRSALMAELKHHIRTNGLSQALAAQAAGVTQPRISDLMRGKINLFGIDALVNMAARLGLQVELQVRRAA